MGFEFNLSGDFFNIFAILDDFFKFDVLHFKKIIKYGKNIGKKENNLAQVVSLNPNTPSWGHFQNPEP